MRSFVVSSRESPVKQRLLSSYANRVATKTNSWKFLLRALERGHLQSRARRNRINRRLTSIANTAWIWGIDTVLPMREIESEGQAKDRADCMKRFKASCIRFAADEANLAEFLSMKRKRQP
jgi:hypothetical protein